MPVKTILLPLCENDTPGPVLETALGLARRFEAHLDILYVLRNPRHHLSMANLGLSKHMREEILRVAEQNSSIRAEQAHQLFSHACASANIPVVESRVGGGVSAAWQEIAGPGRTAFWQCADGCQT